MHDRASIKLDGEPVRSALICIASFFRNDTRRNDLLLDTIHTILSWRIERIKIVVNTNDAAALQHVLQSHNEVEVVQAEFAHRKMLSQGFLAWEHRKAIDRLAPTSSEFDLYGYLEDDARLTWEAVVSWAADESVLSRHAAREGYGTRFHRGFFRYERLRLYGPRPGYNPRNEPLAPFGHYLRDQSRLTPCLGRQNISTWPCQVTIGGRHFISLKNPFSGLWLMGRKRLQAFRSSSHWTPVTSSPGHKHTLTGLGFMHGVKEGAAFGDTYQSAFGVTFRSSSQPPVLPFGCTTSLLVPFIFNLTALKSGRPFPQFDISAGVEHTGADPLARTRPRNMWLRVADCLEMRPSAWPATPVTWDWPW